MAEFSTSINLTLAGLGPVGAFGSGVKALAAALYGPPTTNRTTFAAATTDLSRFVRKRDLRRLDHFSRLGLLGACLAAEDSGIDPAGKRTGLIVGSAFGAAATTFAFLDSVLDDGDTLASPTFFSNSVHNAAAAHISRHLGITGPNLSLAQGTDSLAQVLLTAHLWLTEGIVDQVICGVVDELCQVLDYCRRRYQAYGTGQKPENPLPEPGEGAAFFCCRRPQPTGREAYGRITRIEFAAPPPPPGTPALISYDPVCQGRPSPARPAIDLAPLRGHLPTAAGLDLSAAALLVKEQAPFSCACEAGTAKPPFPSACCWSPGPHPGQKGLTGPRYWITQSVITSATTRRE